MHVSSHDGLINSCCVTRVTAPSVCETDFYTVVAHEAVAARSLVVNETKVSKLRLYVVVVGIAIGDRVRVF